MSDLPKKPEHDVHPDFPTSPNPGSISGSQPKLLLSKGADGTYGSPQRSPEELLHRFKIADDIVGQLLRYFNRKKTAHPEWTDEKNLERIRLALINKAAEGKWKFTEAEQQWIMNRLRELCLDAPGDKTSEHLVREPNEREIPDHHKPVFSLSDLATTPTRTPEQIRRAIAEGRFAEMTPWQAGCDDED
jgi:hypothetical protein